MAFWTIKIIATTPVADMLTGHDKLKKLADDRTEMVIPGHDAEVTRRYPASRPGLEGICVRLDKPGRTQSFAGGAPLQFPTGEDADPPRMKPRLSSSSGLRASRSLMHMSERDARSPEEHEHLLLVGGAPAAKDEYAWTARAPACSTSAVPRRLDRGDVDPLHVHHVATAYSGYGTW
ncbi:MAG TPA: hypothetical protein VK630_01385 [Reyranella sp.]|nr:hypothetical protein [Reyranella sp.]